MKQVIKHWLPIISLLIKGYLLPAQEMAVSEVENVSPKVEHYGVAGQIGSDVYVYKSGFDYFEVSKFGLDKMNRIWNREIELPGKTPEAEEVFVVGDQILVYYTCKQSGKTLFCSGLFDKDFNILQEVTVLDEYDRRFGAKGYEYRVKSNASRTIFVILKLQIKNEDFNSFSCFALNRDQKKIAGPFDEMDNGWYFYDFVVSQEGNAYIVLKEEPSNLFDDAVGTRALKVFHFNPVTETDHSLLVDNLPYELNNYKIKQDENNQNLVIAGFYEASKSKSDLGYFMLKFSTDSLIETVRVFQNLRPLIPAGNFRASRLMENTHLKSLTATGLYLRQDGGALVAGELFTKVRRNTATPNLSVGSAQSMAVNTVSYYYEDMAFLSLDNEGKFLWADAVPKSQITDNDDGYYSSYGTYNSGRHLTFFFNEKANVQSQVSKVRFDHTGHLVLEGMLHSGIYNLILANRFSTQISKKDVIIPGFDQRNNFVLLRARFE